MGFEEKKTKQHSPKFWGGIDCKYGWNLFKTEVNVQKGVPDSPRFWLDFASLNCPTGCHEMAKTLDMPNDDHDDEEDDNDGDFETQIEMKPGTFSEERFQLRPRGNCQNVRPNAFWEQIF